MSTSGHQKEKLYKMFIAVLFKVVKTGSPSGGEWINCSIFIQRNATHK